MAFYLTAAAISAGILGATLVCLQIGHRFGSYHARVDQDAPKTGIGPIEAATFGLLGLMLAFVFGSSASRFDARRHLIVEEANAVGTAWMRTDLLGPDDRSNVQNLMRRYIDARIVDDAEMTDANQAACEAAQADVWAATVVAVRSPSAHPASAQLLVPAANDMFDLASTRYEARRTHVPLLVIVVLIGLVLLAALVAGYAMAARRKKSWLHFLVFAFSMSGALYLIIDLEFPRFGLIQITSTEHVLRDVRSAMK
jgi:uncharacterized membrane protein YhaH (DUF805 family)